MTVTPENKSNIKNTGLSNVELQHILTAAKTLPEIEILILFGSRAKGCYKKGSDVDLAIKGCHVTYESAVKLSEILNERTPLSYFFDVLNYNEITDEELIEHINRVGIILLEKNKY